MICSFSWYLINLLPCRCWVHNTRLSSSLGPVITQNPPPTLDDSIYESMVNITIVSPLSGFISKLAPFHSCSVSMYVANSATFSPGSPRFTSILLFCQLFYLNPCSESHYTLSQGVIIVVSKCACIQLLINRYSGLQWFSLACMPGGPGKKLYFDLRKHDLINSWTRSNIKVKDHPGEITMLRDISFHWCDFILVYIGSNNSTYPWPREQSTGFMCTETKPCW